MEVSLFHNGLVDSYTSHYPGSVSDFEIIQRNIYWNEENLSKEKGSLLVDSGEHSDKYSRQWSFLADKRYQVILKVLCDIHHNM